MNKINKVFSSIKFDPVDIMTSLLYFEDAFTDNSLIKKRLVPKSKNPINPTKDKTVKYNP